MNTIIQWQVFSPIPFSEYNPDIAYSTSKARENELDINRNFGRYDEYNFNHVSFYAKDYVDGTYKIIELSHDFQCGQKIPFNNNIPFSFQREK